MLNDVTGYDLSRDWFDFCFENPEKINPNHSAMYFFIIEHCNRLGWKEKFGLPMEMTKNAIGIKNYKTYSKTFSDLVEWGFISIIQKSANQYSATIIALVKNTKATSKALSKAMLKHSLKQVQSIVCIDKPITYNQEPYNQEQEISILFSIEECLNISLKDDRWVKANKTTQIELKEFNQVLERRAVYQTNPAEYKSHFANWKSKGKLEYSIPSNTATIKMVH